MRETVEQPRISLFDFDDYRDYLVKVGMPDGLYSHTSNNLQSWANRLGYKSPSSLTMVIKGQRSPSFEMINALAEDLEMNMKERQYLMLLVQLEKANKKKKDTKEILEKIAELNSGSTAIALGLKEFSAISEWYFLAIKQLISMPCFIEDEDWIFKKLRKKVTPSQIRNALNIMTEMEAIGRDENGKLIVLKEGLLTTNDVPSSAIKRHHFGMINRALEAIEEQPVKERQVTSVTMRVKPEDVDAAKKAIFEFIKDFNNKFSTTEADELYQLNMQFFKHTREVVRH
ncbi:TIGR02147 family protein [Halobacteriovorax marinus]|uniref:DUF4423 domain-containing protein n=1 Tax=Halobacteriovorax marinus (strain ATCC BAA-682 / DSM 15412 / SJ) TaxID=862908 RepID=E1X5S1_HALMS|nr:DUF4423 domain-containing protein [Halobacteriovorax marinus]ATH07058.1 TIGR02147 family protein [Halobacteriovorax marinus]CBW25638.1 conserved hypothetical protein [Halobacteriovorax marinus SJ]